MFEIGDHVKLTKKSSGYGPGSQGAVATIPEPGVLQVDIYRDEKGVKIVPPDPLPPLPEDYFQ